jgi:hypothetical protein
MEHREMPEISVSAMYHIYVLHPALLAMLTPIGDESAAAWLAAPGNQPDPAEPE